MSSGLINAAFSAEKLREKPLPNTIFLVSQFKHAEIFGIFSM